MKMAPSLEEAERRLAGGPPPLPTASEPLGVFEYSVPSYWIAPTNDRGLIRGFIGWLRPCKPEGTAHVFLKLGVMILISAPLVMMSVAWVPILLVWWSVWVIFRVVMNVRHSNQHLAQRANGRVR